MDDSFSIAVFPFLKTSGPTDIGGYTFRSTEDTTGLLEVQAAAVCETAQMLFLKDDLRVKSASYAITPFIDFNRPHAEIDSLARVRAVVAYIYSSPHDVFENVFLAPEEISLAIFSPGPVSVFLVRPHHHTQSIGQAGGRQPDSRHELPGYHGLYNFRHHFWVAAGSRLYGPKPHMTLNISQDLYADISSRFHHRQDRRLLLRLLNRPITPTTQRIFSAVHWFNEANEESADPDRALLSLAIAFETLLKLPESAKTERLVDAISLLLGRTERLSDWAQQFYEARSRVAHEGRAQDRFYYVPKSAKQKEPSGIFGSLMLYGRHIFQLCLGTLLVGIDLAERADLQERFVANNERYERICAQLTVASDAPRERLAGIKPIVEALSRYQFVAGGRSSQDLMVSAVRRASLALLECGGTLAKEIKDALNAVATGRQNGELADLACISALLSAFEKFEQANLSAEERIVQQLADLAWSKLFPRYYQLKRAVDGE